MEEDVRSQRIRHENVPAGSDPIRAPLAILVGDLAESHSHIQSVLSNGGVVLLALSVDAAWAWLEHEEVRMSNPVHHHEVIRFKELEVDLEARQARWSGRPLSLTDRELEMVSLLAGKPGRAWSFGDLLFHVWRQTSTGDVGLVRCAVRRLRAKLSQANVAVRIEAVRGFGFRLVS